jgi:hypothetical protein
MSLYASKIFLQPFPKVFSIPPDPFCEAPSLHAQLTKQSACQLLS